MARIVQKFGGSSLKNPKFIENAASIICQEANSGNEVVAVVSAMGKTTDELLNLASSLNDNPNLRELDMLLASGEQVSSALMSIAIQKRGLQARAFTGIQAKILTDTNHGEANIKEIETDSIEASLSRGEIAVVAGFQGSFAQNEITTLGRGGSDTTAVALAYAIDAERCDIYTDVAGVYTGDPHLIENSKMIKAISYDEMYEMSISGAKVLNANSVELAKKYEVPVRVRSTFEPDNIGTLVTHKIFTPTRHLTSLSLDLSQSLVSLKMVHNSENLDFVSSLFTRLAELKISIDMFMMIAPEDNLNFELVFAIANKEIVKLNQIINEDNIKQKFKSVEIKEKLAKISLIGSQLNLRSDVIAQLFELVKANKTKLHLVATSDLRVSILVDREKSKSLINLIHNNFFNI